MLIRNQNKKTLTNFAQVTDLEVVQCEDGFEIRAYYPFPLNNDYSKMNLGDYSTEEKAIKVLDMIEDAYRKSFEEKKENYRGHRYNLIFTMPQDNEV